MSLASEVIAAATVRGIRIATAESLTGGLLADALVSIPGASRAFSGGIVAYDTALKASLLGVDPAQLARTGPVDERVARQMAEGARRACAVPRAGAIAGDAVPAEIGVATTGVAGPDPDPQTGLPAGAVWIGVSSAAGSRAVRLDAEGDRAAIRGAAVHAAIRELASELGISLEFLNT